jgi:hypothetical protein
MVAQRWQINASSLDPLGFFSQSVEHSLNQLQ